MVELTGDYLEDKLVGEVAHCPVFRAWSFGRRERTGREEVGE
jgi:hypothetical protein